MMSTITEQDIKALTPQHRVVWHVPPGQPVEMGLYVDGSGSLYTDAGHLVLWHDGMVALGALDCIVKIIPPAFVPRKGLVIGHPKLASRRLVHVGGVALSWLGHVPEITTDDHWFDDDEAHTLVEYHGWEVIEDLAAPGEVTDAEVEAFREWLDSDRDISDETIRAGLEAAREARND